MKKISCSISLCLFLSACGGGGESISAKPLRVFSDGSGIVKATSEIGEIGYIITPNAYELATQLNNDDSNDDETSTVANFPIIGKIYGYTFHEGVEDGLDTLFAVRSTDNPVTFDDISHGLMILSDGNNNAILASTETIGNLPAGSHTYSGVFTAQDSRYPNWMDLGEIDLEVNFTYETFTLDARSDDTNLAGSGFLDTSSGQLSSRNLRLTDYELNEQRDASLVGTVGGSNAGLVAGVWHTNESNPIMSGAFVGHR